MLSRRWKKPLERPWIRNVMRKRNLVAYPLFILLILSAACSHSAGSEEESASAEHAVPEVTLTRVARADISQLLTITGSVANIIVVETARPDVEIEFRDYLRAGVPITILTLALGCAWLAWTR